MIFELHDESKIGYKILSEADLGLKKSSHQTHIGLSEQVLSYLSDREEVSENSIFIYEDKLDYIDAYFDRIQCPNGSFRSPKIRVGERGCVSVVSTIRGIVKNHSDCRWYLVWFGLKSEKIVFFLFNDQSEDYKKILDIGLMIGSKGTKTLDINNPIFKTLVNYLENKMNTNGIEVLKELEVSSQIQEIDSEKKFRRYDIDIANQRFKDVGKMGECLVAKYLSDKVSNGSLTSFTWYNENNESGLPYDFSFQDNNENIYYLDVKTTGFDFNQQMIFSSQEIEFISQSNNNYCIYRVYKDESEKYYLRICDNCRELSKEIFEKTENYKVDLSGLFVSLKVAKLGISPNIKSLKFNDAIEMII